LSVADLVAAGSVSQDIPRAEQLLVEAIDRDPSSSWAHEAMGGVRLRQKNRLHEMQIEYETALALDRNNLNAVRQLSWAFENLGRLHCTAGGKKPAAQPRDPSL
jgi:tetratricopeptide (TPR) repeat protein